MKLTVGRIVQWRSSDKSAWRAAVVVELLGEGGDMASLYVLPRPGDGRPKLFVFVSVHEDAPSGGTNVGEWRWPPREE